MVQYAWRTRRVLHDFVEIPWWPHIGFWFLSAIPILTKSPSVSVKKPFLRPDIH